MSDSTLDDFFAKKDKSKKKTKTKPPQPSDISVIETSSAATKQSTGSKEKDNKNKVSDLTSDLVYVQLNKKEDEEWKDFEETKEVDYSGLRIQKLNTFKENEDRDKAECDDSGISEDDNKESRDRALGPWNQNSTSVSAAPAIVQVQTSQSEDTKEVPTPKSSGKYIPPSQRQMAVNSSSATKLPGSRKNKTTPNVNSEEDFPTLGGKGGSGSKLGTSQYSSAASSDLIDNPNQRRGINLALENKFSALQD